ncbi:MAG TPA: MarR family transcriptional regulator [Spirochaetota bacterium]|nr:MarR family transcriptional regulator [Spirochaetota bacterium]
MFHDSIKVFPQFIKKVLHEHDISELKLDINKTQTKILMFVYENTEKSMSEISLMTSLEKSSFTRSVDYLVKNGFLVKNSPEKDRRKIHLSLTGKGTSAARLIKNDLDIYFESLLSDFSGKEKTEFFESLNSVLKYINQILDGHKRCTARDKYN